MPKLTSDSLLKINKSIHGWVAGDTLVFGKLPYEEQILARRRIADGGGSVEVVEQNRTQVNAKEKKDGNNIKSKD